jgi:hypothetical protein
MSMDSDLTPFDVAQHWPFLEQHLFRLPLAVSRALRIVAEGQVDTDGEACSVRQRLLAEPYASPGMAGRASVVLNQLEEREVLIRYRGRGRRPHLWSFRPDLSRWRGFAWSPSAEGVNEAVSQCFCRAAGDLVARIPGQRLVELRRRAKFELLSRDHIRPPGLLLVETRDKGESRATRSDRPGFLPVETRDKSEDPFGLSVMSQEVELLELGEAERDRFALLKAVVDFHCTEGSFVRPGTTIEKTLVRLARELDHGQTHALRKHFDRTAGKALAPGLVASLERMAVGMLAKSRQRERVEA